MLKLPLSIAIVAILAQMAILAILEIAIGIINIGRTGSPIKEHKKKSSSVVLDSYKMNLLLRHY